MHRQQTLDLWRQHSHTGIRSLKTDGQGTGCCTTPGVAVKVPRTPISLWLHLISLWVGLARGAVPYGPIFVNNRLAKIRPISDKMVGPNYDMFNRVIIIDPIYYDPKFFAQ